jgi:hypothetical protein
MTARETQIAKRILDFLHEQDSHQVHRITLHAEIGGLPTCSSAELDEVLARLDTERYVIGIKTKFKGTLWSISEAGEAARMAMI